MCNILQFAFLLTDFKINEKIDQTWFCAQMMCKVIGGFLIHFNEYGRHDDNARKYTKLLKIKINKHYWNAFWFFSRKSNPNYVKSSVTSFFILHFLEVLFHIELCIQDASRRFRLWKKLIWLVLKLFSENWIILRSLAISYDCVVL